MKKIIGIGNALVDLLAPLQDDHLLAELGLSKGGMMLIDEKKLKEILVYLTNTNKSLATGGSASNAMLALANLGVRPGLIGKVGKDEYGTFFRTNSLEKGIQANLIECDMPTGIATTFISADGERTFGTFLGAAASMNAAELTSALFEGYDYLLIEGYLVQNHELIIRAAELAHKLGIKVCLDLASYNIVEAQLDFFRSFVSTYVDILFANEEESYAFTKKEPEAAVNEIAQMCEIAVVKLGANGVWAKQGDKILFEPSIQVNTVIDTTGAGDFFAGGFLYALASGKSLKKCVQIGAILGAHVIQQIGTSLPDPLWHEIKLKVSENLNS